MMFKHKYIRLLYIAVSLLFLTACAQQGYLRDSEDLNTYSLQSEKEYHYYYNPVIIVAGDSQPGKRIVEKALRKENWLTWKQAIVPFYQIYLFGNGVWGASNHLRHMATYGKSSRTLMRDAVLKAYNSDNCDFMLHLGDIVGSDGRYPDHWKLFLNDYGKESEYLNDIKIYPVVGNHEHANNEQYGFENYEFLFNTPRFYVIESPDIAIFVLDSNFLFDRYNDFDNKTQEKLYEKWFISNDPANPSWLEKELESHNQKYKVVAMHHSPFMLGWHFKDWYIENNGKNLVEKRNKLVNLFAENDVQLVLSGHEHYYQHNYWDINNESYDIERMHFVVSSSAGVPVRNKPSDSAIKKKLKVLEQEGYSITAQEQISIYHYSTMEIVDDNLVLETYEVDESGKEADKLFESIVIEAVSD